MKKLRLLTILSAFTLAAASAAGLASFKVGKKAEAVHAVSFSAGTNIYLAGTGDIDITGSTLSAWVFYTSGSHWEKFEFDDLSGYYMITLDETASGLTFARTEKGSNNGTQWGDVGSVYNQTDMSFESGKNWIWPKNWNNSITCEWRYIYYHVAGSFTSPGWQGTNASYKMTDGFDDESNHQASFTLTTTTTNVEVKCTTNYNGTVPNDNWYGTLVSGYNTEYIDTNSGNIVLKKAATYEIYLKSNRQVWAQISSADEADHYAETFLSNITCTQNSVTSLLNAWNKVGSETTSMEYKFEKLTTGAKNVLKGTTGNENGTNVQKCIARYDRILGKYGYGTASGQYHDFMGRTPASLSSAKLAFPINNDTSNLTGIIVIISLVSVSAVGGFFFIRKRKSI